MPFGKHTSVSITSPICVGYQPALAKALLKGKSSKTKAIAEIDAEARPIDGKMELAWSEVAGGPSDEVDGTRNNG